MDSFDYKVLAVSVLNIPESYLDKSDFDINDAISEKFGVDLDKFILIAEALLDFTPVINPPELGNPCHAFVKVKGQLGRVLVSKTL
ncbi:hypothetical protein [Zooshikella sp. RANM57]|uniref:hypothetical protein n=1 Tax=Zooshikella sp. RANM57 TaxID=3425863 RepID=UPI003D6E3312